MGNILYIMRIQTYPKIWGCERPPHLTLAERIPTITPKGQVLSMRLEISRSSGGDSPLVQFQIRCEKILQSLR